MKRIVLYGALAMAGIVALLGAVAVYIAATFDPNDYKPQIVQAVKDRTQRTLKLEGDIRLSFFPDIGASIGKASLSERASDREFAGAEELHIALKLRPLLSGEPVIDAIDATNLRARLVRYRDGSTNFDDLTGAAKSPSPNEGGSGVGIDIHRVSIKNAAITYTDEAAGSHYSFTALDLKTGRIANGVPTRIGLSTRIQSDKPKLDLETTLKGTVRANFDTQNYAVDEIDLEARGQAAGISNLAASAKGSIDARVASSAFAVSGLALAATGKQDGGDLNFKFAAPRLSVTKDQVSGDRITLDGVFSQARRRLAVRLDIPAIAGSAKSFAAGELSAALDLRQEDATTSIKLSGPLAGSVEHERVELPKLVAAVRINNKKLPKNPLDATINGAAQIDLAKQLANLTFATKVDDSNISGRAGLAKFVPPFYTFDISVDQLDADRYLPPPEQKRSDPFDLSLLKGLNATGSVRIGTLKLGNVKASNVRFDVKAANSAIDSKALAANPYRAQEHAGASHGHGDVSVLSGRDLAAQARRPSGAPSYAIDVESIAGAGPAHPARDRAGGTGSALRPGEPPARPPMLLRGQA